MTRRKVAFVQQNALMGHLAVDRTGKAGSCFNLSRFIHWVDAGTAHAVGPEKGNVAS